MAGNIKTFESPVDKLTPTSIGAEAYEMEGRHVEANYANAGQKIGGAIQGLGKQLEQHDTVVQTADLMKNMSDIEIQAHQDLQKAKQTMDIHDPDAVNKYMENYQDQLQNITSKTYTSKAYDAMTRMTSDFNQRARQNFNDYQSTAIANDTKAKYDGSVDNWAILGSQDPNFAKSGVAAIKLAGESLDVGYRSQAVLQGVNHVMDTTAEGITSRVEGMKVFDPTAVQAAKDYINDPKNGFVAADVNDKSFMGMSSAKYEQVMNRLDNMKRSGSHETTAGIRLNTPAMIKQMGETGTVPKDFDAAIGRAQALQTPEGDALADELMQERKNATEGVYPARQVLSQTPADKIAQTIDAMKNESINPNMSGSDIATSLAKYDAAIKLNGERQEAFSGANPIKQGQWVIDNNSSVRTAYDAWRKNPTSPDAFMSYYLKSEGMQRYLEPGKLPSFVTQDIANDGTRIMNEITHDPKAGALQADQDLAKMAQIYGPAWPSIASDLAKRKIFNGTQMVAATLYSDPNAVVWAKPLLTASTMTDKELEERNGVSSKKAEDLVRPEIETLVKSMGNINNADELANTYISAAAKIVQLQGLDDASGLVKTLFTDRFQFVGPGSTIRLSRDFPDGDAIGDGASAVLHDIGNHDLVVPSSGRLGSINVKEAWADALGANGVWNTSPNGQGATLYDGHGNEVLERRNGRVVPVELSFQELARLGKGNPVNQSTIQAEESHIK